MFELVIIAAAGLVAGAFLPRKPKEKRCSAAWEKQITIGEGYRRQEKIVWVRCEAIADARCTGGNCTLHCRDKNRCGGKCLSLLDELTR